MNKHDFLKQNNLPIKIILTFLVMFSLLNASSLYAQTIKKNPTDQGLTINNTGIDLWNQVRQRDGNAPVGTSQVKSVDSGVLINARGDEWANFRMNQLILYSQYALGAVLVILLLIYFLMGTSKIEGGPSGNMVQRFKKLERWTHWAMAIFFIGLAITGIVLMFGRGMLIPLLGKEAFSGLAVFSKTVHNWSGPLFLFSLLLMLVTFMRKNIYASGDLGWLLKAGGVFSKDHMSAGFFNMGEKIMFWLVILVGLVLSISGLVLLFPGYGQDRIIMELSHATHGISSIFLIALTLGHMYMALVGVEGTTQAMTHGYVDIKWVEAHHDRWAEEVKQKNLVIPAAEFTQK